MRPFQGLFRDGFMAEGGLASLLELFGRNQLMVGIGLRWEGAVGLGEGFWCCSFANPFPCRRNQSILGKQQGKSFGIRLVV